MWQIPDISTPPPNTAAEDEETGAESETDNEYAKITVTANRYRRCVGGLKAIKKNM